jgi:hypothetical protein
MRLWSWWGHCVEVYFNDFNYLDYDNLTLLQPSAVALTKHLTPSPPYRVPPSSAVSLPATALLIWFNHGFVFKRRFLEAARLLGRTNFVPNRNYIPVIMKKRPDLVWTRSLHPAICFVLTKHACRWLLPKFFTSSLYALFYHMVAVDITQERTFRVNLGQVRRLPEPLDDINSINMSPR